MILVIKDNISATFAVSSLRWVPDRVWNTHRTESHPGIFVQNARGEKFHYRPNRFEEVKFERKKI